MFEIDGTCRQCTATKFTALKYLQSVTQPREAESQSATLLIDCAQERLR